MYQNRDYIKLLNDLNNFSFFIVAFFILFLFEISGYFTKKNKPRQFEILLQSEAK